MKNDMLDKYIGCLVGGAAGDALGYEVEFSSEHEIFTRYGDSGISEYALHGGLARISDDTQMTMFTAAGLLSYESAARQNGGASRGGYAEHIAAGYRDWYRTQCTRFSDLEHGGTWLMGLRELYFRRAPGGTCLSAIERGCCGTVDMPVNNSKGCGGIMRVAPIGLFFKGENSADNAARVGAEAAALTHGHPLGYISAAALAYLVSLLVHGGNISLSDAALKMLSYIKSCFAGVPELGELAALVERAIRLSAEDVDDLDAIHLLGEGWVGEETLAIAVYCALKNENDFDLAIRSAVNHNGDSDSTGAVAGNILGAYLGIERIPRKYIENLELMPELRVLAQDLYTAAYGDDPDIAKSLEKYPPYL